MHTVLIVEPDRPFAELLRRNLMEQYEPVVVHDAQTAVSEADARTPDIVILELAMPKHNGIAFMQEFRSYNDWINVPIVIYSHIPREDTGLTEQQWLKLGVQLYLYKPTIRFATLTNHIDHILNSYETA